MSTKKIQLKRPIVENPDLQAFIDALIHNDGIDSGRHDAGDKLLTAQDLFAIVIDDNGNVTFIKNVNLTDDNSLYLGTDNDLQLVHNGTNASINNDTGVLSIRANLNSGTIQLNSNNSSGTEKFGIIIGGATPYCRLYYDGIVRLTTTSLGISLDGGSTTPTILFDSGDYIEYNQASNYYNFRIGSTVKVEIDNTSTAGNTALLLWDVDNGSLERVTVGAADSGGAGFKALRIPN